MSISVASAAAISYRKRAAIQTQSARCDDVKGQEEEGRWSEIREHDMSQHVNPKLVFFPNWFLLTWLRPCLPGLSQKKKTMYVVGCGLRHISTRSSIYVYVRFWSDVLDSTLHHNTNWGECSRRAVLIAPVKFLRRAELMPKHDCSCSASCTLIILSSTFRMGESRAAVTRASPNNMFSWRYVTPLLFFSAFPLLLYVSSGCNDPLFLTAGVQSSKCSQNRKIRLLDLNSYDRFQKCQIKTRD